jgi:hypothetical protein
MLSNYLFSQFWNLLLYLFLIKFLVFLLILTISVFTHNFFDLPVFCHSIYMAKPAQYLGLNIIHYILISN